MKIRQKIIPLFALFVVAVVLLAVIIPQQLAARPLCNSQGFTITGADANWCFSTTSLSATFSNLLDLVAPRVGFDYARANYLVGLTAVPPTMATALDQVAARVGFDYARSNRSETLQFPVDLVNDTTNPQLTGNITESTSGANSSKIIWTTNEFADSIVQYGATPGNYTQTVSDNLYVTTHQVTLTGLQEGVAYYYRVSSSDLSGNTFQSAERTFEFIPQTYLLNKSW